MGGPRWQGRASQPVPPPPPRLALLPAGFLGPRHCHCGISNLGPLGAAFSASPSSVWKLPQHSALFLLPLLLGHPGRPSARLARRVWGARVESPTPTGAGPSLPPPAFPPSVLWLEVSRCRIRWCGLRNQTPGVGSGLRTDGRGPLGALPPNPNHTGSAALWLGEIFWDVRSIRPRDTRTQAVPGSRSARPAAGTPHLPLAGPSPRVSPPRPHQERGTASRPSGPSWRVPRFIHGLSAPARSESWAQTPWAWGARRGRRTGHPPSSRAPPPHTPEIKKNPLKRENTPSCKLAQPVLPFIPPLKSP